METVIGLLFMLLGVSYGVETHCDGRQDGAQCYVALGGTVDIQLMNSTSEIPRYQLLKDSLKILAARNNTVISNAIEHRSLIFPSNGTFRINDLSRNDIGKYTLETFDSDGRKSGERTLYLFTQGVETYCDGRQDGAQCYGALGGTVDIQLMDSTSEIPRYQLLKDSLKILDVKGDKVISNTIAHRYLIFPSNGTFRINGLSRTDIGKYTLQTFDSDGRTSDAWTLHLFIQGVETYCDGRQDGAQCYGALGGTVDIQLMDNTFEISRYQLLKNAIKILDVRMNKVLSNTIAHKSLIIPSNGTFRISDLSRTDSGNYSLITFDSDGTSSGEQTLQLFIQAPVSSVLLVSECLSQGWMRVSCSSEGGDSPQYSWTLDGRTLTDAELLPGNNETNIITLKQHVSRHLVCSVRNNVSSVSKEQEISTCVE